MSGGRVATLATSVRELGALGPLAIFLVVGPAVGAVALAATAELWLDPARAAGDLAIPIYVGASVVLAGLSLVPTHASSLVGGLLFGAVTGSLLALASVLGAAALGFAVLRRLVGDRAIRQLAHRERAAAVHRELLQRGHGRTVGLIVLVRLSPVMPFAGTNLLMAAARVRLAPFLVGSMLGIAPRVVVVAVAGAGLSSLDPSQGGSRGLLFVGVVATVAALAVVQRLARRAVRSVGLG